MGQAQSEDATADDESAIVARDSSAALAVLENPDLVARVLDHFRTHQLLTLSNTKVDATQERYNVKLYEVFFEPIANLECIVSFATCSRATRAVGLGDVVWTPFCKTAETQFPSGIGFEDYKFDDGRHPALPDKYKDPRVDPEDYVRRTYASRSVLERYTAVRAFYKRVRAELMACRDERTWSTEDRRRLESTARWAMENLELQRDLDIDEMEYEAAFRYCTAKEVANAQVEMYAMKDLAEGNVCGHARTLLQLGWQHVDFGDSTYGDKFLDILIGLQTRDGEPVWCAGNR